MGRCVFMYGYEIEDMRMIYLRNQDELSTVLET